MPWNPEYYMKKKEVIKILEDNKITNVVPPRKKMICPNCKGNGFTRHVFEAEEHELQCKTCHSEGEVPADTFFFQVYEDKNWLNEWSPCYYHGPCLDHTLFRKLRIIQD